MINLTLFDNYPDLAAHHRQWDQVAGPFPFFRWAWVGSWLEHVAKNRELAVLVATDRAGNWLGIAPFCIETTLINVRRLQFVGGGQACSDYMKLLVDKPNYREFADEVVKWLGDNTGAAGQLGGIDLIELEGLSESDPTTDDLIGLFQVFGFKAHRISIEGCWVTELTPTWNELNAQFSKSLRRKTKRAMQLLDSAETEVRSSRHHDWKEVWTSFVSLHQQRHEVIGHKGCFADESFSRFLETAAKRLAAENKAEVVEILRDGSPLAAMLLLNDGENAYMYQSGFDPQRDDQIPGYQLVVHALRSSIGRGFKTFDFLRGDEPYKARWQTRRTGLQTVKLVPTHMKARVSHQIWLSAKSLKHYASKGLNFFAQES